MRVVYLLRDFDTVLLEVHDGIRNFYVDGVDNQFNVEWTKQTIGDFH